jgi:hypothetical protein
MADGTTTHDAACQELPEGRKGLSPKEFAAATGFSLATVHRRLAKNQLPKFQPGGKRTRILIPLDAFSGNQPEATQPPADQRADDTAANGAPACAEKNHLSGRKPGWMERLP